MLRLYDTARRAKVDFVPSVEGRVSMYVCGATPYDVPHLGHGRKEVVFDTIRRYLVWRGYAVKFVSNVTDIEDKIIARAHEEGTTEPELVARFAMSLKLLGDGFDIHGGGNDLVFPHHENEIAQAVGAGHEFARYWLHNGMLNVDGQKMSKSLGNFVTLVDVLERYDPRAFRLLVL